MSSSESPEAVQDAIYAGAMRTLLALTLTACGFGDATLEEIDPEAAPARPTWTAHVEPIIELYCTACHAHDAPVGHKHGFGYDDCETTKDPHNWAGFRRTVFNKEQHAARRRPAPDQRGAVDHAPVGRTGVHL